MSSYDFPQRYIGEAGMYPDLELARITAQHRGKYHVNTQQGHCLAEISGKLRYETDDLAMFPAVGDYVMVKREGDLAIIHHLLTRKSLFVRKAVGMQGQAQAVAANVDVAFLCMSLNQNYSLNRMERYLSAAWDSGATPVVVLTKADLCDDLEGAVAEVERISLYSDVIALSMFDQDIPQKFAPYFEQGQTCAFIGSSGVGKSTLINCLLGSNVIQTNQIGKGDKGRHTTTGRQMLPCPLGGVVIDTPGMREMGVDSADTNTTFADIEEPAQGCRFADCTHTEEPGCAVLAAVDAGMLDQRRLDSYLKLELEAGYEGLSSKEIEAKKFERMFKDVGGMKAGRKNVKKRPY